MNKYWRRFVVAVVTVTITVALGVNSPMLPLAQQLLDSMIPSSEASTLPPTYWEELPLDSEKIDTDLTQGVTVFKPYKVQLAGEALRPSCSHSRGHRCSCACHNRRETMLA
jgi:hypothetical protein